MRVPRVVILEVEALSVIDAVALEQFVNFHSVTYEAASAIVIASEARVPRGLPETRENCGFLVD
jgi:hypothetical protein